MKQKKLFILGVGGFIGSSLLKKVLRDYPTLHISGIDVESFRITSLIGHARFDFKQGDIYENKAWIQETLQKSDIILPLVAIANPALYVRDPLRVFELDFESNLEIIRLCVEFKKRLIFPSTSEVYGMCSDQVFDEEESPCVTGSIKKQRWIYSSSKQLLDRVIYAYGVQRELNYTIFRPFNWIGPGLDRVSRDPQTSARVLTRFLSDALYYNKISIVDGGHQRRCFTDIRDGIQALCHIILDEEGRSFQKIFNIGSPHNNHSIQELAHIFIQTLDLVPSFKKLANTTQIVHVSGREHYGDFYEDVDHRVPSIKRMQEAFGWEPQFTLQQALLFFLEHVGEYPL